MDSRRARREGFHDRDVIILLSTPVTVTFRFVIIVVPVYSLQSCSKSCLNCEILSRFKSNMVVRWTDFPALRPKKNSSQDTQTGWSHLIDGLPFFRFLILKCGLASVARDSCFDSTQRPSVASPREPGFRDTMARRRTRSYEAQHGTTCLNSSAVVPRCMALHDRSFVGLPGVVN